MITRKRKPVVALKDALKITNDKKKKLIGEPSRAKCSDSLEYAAPGCSKQSPKTPTISKLPQSFYDASCAKLAIDLLGKKLVRQQDDGKILEGFIVETEAYLGAEDKAAHSYQMKRTAKNEAMFMPPGTVYVYHIYGLYTCVNISSKGEGCAVLIRAVDPCQSSTDAMATRRSQNKKLASKKSNPMKPSDLCSGPSKLTQAFDIKKLDFNKTHLCQNDKIWLENGIDVDPKTIIACPRIGINYAGDWVDKPLRFYVQGNPSVSVKNKEKEKEFKNEPK